ncbi:DUF3530 family protein [Solemya velesiana gill symbiont]|uniref:DUF3530 family protein n=1 Tax=Solemya velesiana gill symbiont TaxID=1918948 RepID=A0A1T2KXN6_9GAMM|nr:DUF3530 family protein [Solemya velesiana gill symbiont]OOZ37619.1 hypothetical protein BOW51_01615 [Solemya velesiana gill symbiont]
MHLKAFFFSVLCIFWVLASASDLVREHLIASEIEDSIAGGNPIRLKTGDTTFLAIHSEVDAGARRGGVILLHDREAHPDWRYVISPLRMELPESGWETLSIQLPVAAKDAPPWLYRELIPESFPRIKFAVEYFKQRKITDLVLLGHGLGARAGAEFLGAGVPGEIKAFVAVGLPAQGAPNTLEALKKINIPILDLYGSRDIDSVLESTVDRVEAAREGGNSHYRQREVVGADHFFTGRERHLVGTIRDWMRKSLSE